MHTLLKSSKFYPALWCISYDTKYCRFVYYLQYMYWYVPVCILKYMELRTWYAIPIFGLLPDTFEGRLKRSQILFENYNKMVRLFMPKGTITQGNVTVRMICCGSVDLHFVRMAPFILLLLII